MKQLSFAIRLLLAATFLFSSSLLPHHHHHGEPCWGMSDKALHHHKEQKCPTEPCHDSSCFIQMIKDFGIHNTFSKVVPSPFQTLVGKGCTFAPLWQWIQPFRRKHFNDVLVKTDFSVSLLRGPPSI